jgi:hypothetical protein
MPDPSRPSFIERVLSMPTAHKSKETLMMVVIQNQELVQRLMDKAEQDGCSLEDIIQSTLSNLFDVPLHDGDESPSVVVEDLRRVLDMNG